MNEIHDIVGYRPKGSSIFFAWERGYICPICKTIAIWDGDGNLVNEKDLIMWSEFSYFLWCPICKVDIPFAFCWEIDVTNIAKTREIFLNFIQEIKEKIKSEK